MPLNPNSVPPANLNEMALLGVELNDRLNNNLAIDPTRRRDQKVSGANFPGDRKALIAELMAKHMAAQSDPNVPQSYRDDLMRTLQGLALEDRYNGVPAPGEIGPRPPGAR
jgi:hypothetical protein